MKNLLTIFFLLLSIFAYSQALFEFDKIEHDFGEVKEEGGVVSHFFVFKNSGTTPLVVSDVTASCGCTKPKWTTDSILPGEEGRIEVGFFPENHPGPFKKVISVKANTQPPITDLYISGIVLPRLRDPKIAYPQSVGNLRTKSRSIYMLIISNDKVKNKKVELFNASVKPIMINNIETPEHIAVDISNDTIPGNTAAYMMVKYDPVKKNDYGPVSDTITLYTTDSLVPVKTFPVFGTIIESFKNLTEDELLDAPRLVLDKKEQDLGEYKKDTILSADFTLTNEGVNDLHIRKVAHACRCTSSDLSDTLIKQNESITLTILLDTRGYHGRQTKHIKIFSNDPEQPIVDVSLKFRVDTD